jgi:hypothetical protein
MCTIHNTQYTMCTIHNAQYAQYTICTQMPYSKQNMSIFFHLGANATKLSCSSTDYEPCLCVLPVASLTLNSRVLFEKLAVIHLVTKFTYFHGTRTLRLDRIPRQTNSVHKDARHIFEINIHVVLATLSRSLGLSLSKLPD